MKLQTQRGRFAALTLAALTSTLVASQAYAALDVKLTGFLKASAIGSDKAVESYGAKNYVAPTSARPQYNLGAAPNEFRSNQDGGLSFQTAQSRFGFVVTVDETTKAVFEFDFVDFNRSSPTVQQYPRVRIAKIEHRLSDNLAIQAGQDWDIFAPLNTFTYNYVGNTFQAGNAGFMRQQAVLVHTTEGFEQKAAISLFTANPGSPVTGTANINDAERGAVPGFAYSAAWGTTPNRVGLSAFYSRFIVRPTTGREMADVYGLNAFAEQKWGGFDFRAEAYYGQNLNNSNSMLTLATRNPASANDVTEAGGWVSGRLPVGEKTNLFGSVGYASILDESKVVAGPAFTTSDANMTAGTMVSNLAAKLGSDHKLTDKLSVFGEISHFNSRFKITGAEAGNATLAEVGLFLFL